MAENVIVRVREDGSLKVVRNFKNIGDSARGASNGVGILQRALGVLGGVLAVRSVIQYADSYVQLQNRIKLVTKSSGELKAVTEELRKTANETRTSFQGTGEFYARAALSARNLGVSQKQLLDLTRSVNQAIILSGATAVEAEKGLIQFAQGIASGTLRGDELRSVLEQLPLVADVIAKQLGVTRGELRKLGADGRITSQIILEAFKNSREELEKAFKNTTPTIQQAFTVLRNEVVVFIGRINEGNGIFTKFAQLILKLAEHVETFARVVGAGALTVALTQAANGIKAIGLAIAANPIGLIVTGVVLAISTLIAFSDQIGLSHKGLITLQDVFVGFLNAVKSALGPFIETWKEGLGQIGKLIGGTFGDFRLDLRTSLVGVGKFADAIVGIFVGLSLGAREAVLRVTDALALLFQGDLGGARSTIVGIGGAVKDAFLTGLEITTFTSLAEKTFDNAAEAAAKRLGEKNKELRAGPVDLTTAGAGTEPPPTGKKRKGPRFTLADAIRELENEGRLLQLNNRERDREAQLLAITEKLRKAGQLAALTPAAQAELEALVRRNQLLNDQAELYDEIKGPMDTYLIQTEALNVLHDSGRITVEEYQKKLAELNRTILETDNSASGAGKGFLAGLIQPAESLFNSLEQTGIGTMQAFGDALGETLSRKGNIGDFFDSFKAGLSDVLGQLAQLTFRLLLIQSITALGGGGFLASIGVTGAGAFGGTFQGGREGRMIRTGENGPENVFVGPGQQANVQPVQQPQSQQVNVIAVADPKDVPAFLNSTEGGQTIVQLVSRNRNQIRAALGV